MWYASFICLTSSHWFMCGDMDTNFSLPITLWSPLCECVPFGATAFQHIQ